MSTDNSTFEQNEEEIIENPEAEPEEAPPPPKDEQILAKVGRNGLEAYIEFIPPENGGRAVERSEVLDALEEAKVIYGLDDAVIDRALVERQKGVRYTAAKATAPVNGEDGRLVFHFDTAKKSGLPTPDEMNRVDFRDLDLFEPVVKGQLLVTRIPPTPGTPGTSVNGAALPQKPGKPVILPKAKNCEISEDFSSLVASISGQVFLKNSEVIVSDLLTLDACDMSTGNIFFEGNVEIKGNVTTGMRLCAAGNITVGGLVSDAELIAGKDVVLKRGIRGAEKGSIVAEGSVTASFIERAQVAAGVDINADVVMHSSIRAGHSVVLKGKHGSIIGGKALVGMSLFAKSIGSISYGLTEIEVGLPPAKQVRLRELRAELELLEKEDEKLTKLVRYLMKSPERISPDKLTLLADHARVNKAELDLKLASCRTELAALEDEAERATDGRIHCSGEINPGTMIRIGNGTIKVSEEMRYTTFKYANNEVVFTAYEI